MPSAEEELLVKYVACFLMLVSIVCLPAAGEQMKVGDLYKLCASSGQSDKAANFLDWQR